MNVRFQIHKNSFGEEGIAFIGENNEDLYFIPQRLLYRVDHNFRILDKYFIGDVLHYIVELYKMDWISMKILDELTKYIQDSFPSIEPDLIADTYRAINEFKKIEIIDNNFLKDNPKPDFSIDNPEKYHIWKKQLKAYRNDNYIFPSDNNH